MLTEAKSVIYDRFKVTIKVKAEVGILDGEPEVEVTSISFGFIPMPGILKDRIVDMGMQKVDAVKNQLTGAGTDWDGKVIVEFTDIDIEESKASITVAIKGGD